VIPLSDGGSADGGDSANLDSTDDDDSVNSGDSANLAVVPLMTVIPLAGGGSVNLAVVPRI
jgi:hypothetical protein